MMSWHFSFANILQSPLPYILFLSQHSTTYIFDENIFSSYLVHSLTSAPSTSLLTLFLSLYLPTTHPPSLALNDIVSIGNSHREVFTQISILSCKAFSSWLSGHLAYYGICNGQFSNTEYFLHMDLLSG